MQFPEGNPGAYPLDPASEVGQFRLVYGDTDSTPYDPEEPGFQNYEELSDADIEALLDLADGSIPRAIGHLYIRLAGKAAKEARSVKDYDLQVDTTKRAADLRAVAQIWFDQADQEDVGDAEDSFNIVPMGDRPVPYPEAAARPFGWC